jgi:hypothetical protein
MEEVMNLINHQYELKNSVKHSYHELDLVGLSFHGFFLHRFFLHRFFLHSFFLDWFDDLLLLGRSFGLFLIVLFSSQKLGSTLATRRLGLRSTRSTLGLGLRSRDGSIGAINGLGVGREVGVSIASVSSSVISGRERLRILSLDFLEALSVWKVSDE